MKAPKIRYYVGGRTEDRKVWVGVRSEGEKTHRDLPMRLDLYNHSPSGFEYGYGGSGPAQLALAILADHLKHFPEDCALIRRFEGMYDDVAEESTDRHAVWAHQAYKFAVIAPLKGKSFQITSEEVSTVLRKMAEARGR